MALVLMFMLVFAFSFRKVYDNDAGIHLRTGEWMFKNFSFPDKDTFTYTVNTHSYTDIEWIHQIGLYGLYKAGGYELLSIYNALLALVLFSLLYYRNVINSVSKPVNIGVLTLALFIVQSRFNGRPEMFSFIFFVSTLIVLDLYTLKKKDVLFLLPFIQVLWINVHGLHILGWILFALYFFNSYLNTKQTDKHLLKWMLIAIASCMLNPYFIKGVMHPFYLFTRFSKSNPYASVINEFQPLFDIKYIEVFPYIRVHILLFFMYLFIIIIALAFNWKKIMSIQFIFMMMFLYLAFLAVRNIPFFVILTIPYTVQLINNISYLQKFKEAGFYILIFVLVFTSYSLAGNKYYEFNRLSIETGMGISKKMIPEKAANFLVGLNSDGRILNDFNTGAWIEWKAKKPVFIDARNEVIQENFLQEYLNSNQPGGLTKLIDKYQPEFIIFNYTSGPTWNRQLPEMPEWRPVYLDEMVVIYAKNKTLPTIDINSLLGATIKKTYTNEEIWKILKGESYSAEKKYPDTQLSLSLFFSEVGQQKVSELLLIDAFNRSHGELKDIYGTLAHIYINEGQFDKASWCYRQYIASFNFINKKIKGKSVIANAYHNLGYAYQNLGQYNEAINNYNEALTYKTDYTQAYLNRGISNYYLNNQTKACADWAKAASLGFEGANKLIQQYCK